MLKKVKRPKDWIVKIVKKKEISRDLAQGFHFKYDFYILLSFTT